MNTRLIPSEWIQFGNWPTTKSSFSILTRWKSQLFSASFTCCSAFRSVCSITCTSTADWMLFASSFRKSSFWFSYSSIWLFLCSSNGSNTLLIIQYIIQVQSEVLFSFLIFFSRCFYFKSTNFLNESFFFIFVRSANIFILCPVSSDYLHQHDAL